MNFSLVFFDLGLVQYSCGIVKEQVYIKTISKIYKCFLEKKQTFKSRNGITSQIAPTAFGHSELQQLNITITASH